MVGGGARSVQCHVLSPYYGAPLGTCLWVCEFSAVSSDQGQGGVERGSEREHNINNVSISVHHSAQ